MANIPWLNPILISSWVEFRFVKVAAKYLNSSTLSNAITNIYIVTSSCFMISRHGNVQFYQHSLLEQTPYYRLTTCFPNIGFNVILPHPRNSGFKSMLINNEADKGHWKGTLELHKRPPWSLPTANSILPTSCVICLTANEVPVLY
jgi:hypothetical protein